MALPPLWSRSLDNSACPVTCERRVNHESSLPGLGSMDVRPGEAGVRLSLRSRRASLREVERPTRVDRECDPHQSDLPSRRAGTPQRERAPCQLPEGVSRNPLKNGSSRARLEDDAQREVQRAARADERAGQLEIGPRVDEQPAVLGAEAEKPELVETPAGDALVFGGQLVREWWELCCGHVPAVTTGCPRSLLAERKSWLRRRCARLAGGR